MLEAIVYTVRTGGLGRDLPEVFEHWNQMAYRDIIKSMGLVGGSAVVTVLLGALRSKLVSAILGPEAIGMMGVLTSITNLGIGTFALGTSTSGVRQVARAASSGDARTVWMEATAIGWCSRILGPIGGVAVALASGWISYATFSSSSQAGAIAIISLTVWFGILSGGHAAVLQGLRQIGELAKTNILGAACSLAVTAVTVLAWGLDGIAPGLAVGSCLAWAIAARATKRLKGSHDGSLSGSQLKASCFQLVALGGAFLTGGILTNASAYVLRALVVRELGLDAAGHYQAAWTLAGTSVGFILSSMGANYLPSLCSCSEDHPRLNRMVSEQLEVAVLLGLPGILVTYLAAPLLVTALYSSEFGPAIDVLRWQLMGVLARLVAWPIGYVLLAKARGSLFVGAEFFSHGIHLLGVLVLVDGLGLVGTGMAFLVFNLFTAIQAYAFVRHLTGYRLGGAARSAIVLSVVSSVAVGCLTLGYGDHALARVLCWMIAVLVTAICGRRLGGKAFGKALWLRIKTRLVPASR
jgi:PST family polysaccharide transporter